MGRLAAAALLAALMACVDPVESHISDSVERMAGTRASTRLIAETPQSRKYALTFAEPEGKGLEYFLRTPKRADGRVPAVLILAGFDTGRDVLDLISDEHPVVLVSMNYPHPGVAGEQTVLEALPPTELRQVAYRSLEGAVLALDHLSRRSDVDPDRIIVLGVSFGSIFAIPLGAYDPRPDAAVVVFGGADLPLLVMENVEETPAWLPRFTLPLITRLYLGEFEPGRHAPGISPRPLWIVSSRQDEFFPAESAQALYRSARHPKKHLWFDAGHMDLFRMQTLREVAGIVVGELRDAGLLIRPEEDVPRGPPGPE